MKPYELKNLKRIHTFFKVNQLVSEYKICVFFQMNTLNAETLISLKQLLKDKNIDLSLLKKTSFTLNSISHVNLNYSMNNNTYVLLIPKDNTFTPQIKKLIEDVTLSNMIPSFIIYENQFISWDHFLEIITHSNNKMLSILEYSYMDLFKWIENIKCQP